MVRIPQRPCADIHSSRRRKPDAKNFNQRDTELFQPYQQKIANDAQNILRGHIFRQRNDTADAGIRCKVNQRDIETCRFDRHSGEVTEIRIEVDGTRLAAAGRLLFANLFQNSIVDQVIDHRGHFGR